MILFIFLIFLFFSRFPPYLTGNEGCHYFTTRALVEEGTLQLDYYRGFDSARSGGHLYSNKPPGLAFLVFPFYFFFFHLCSNHFIPGIIFLRSLSALFATFSAGMVYLISRELGSSEEASFFSALVCAFATLLFPYSTLFMDHTASSFFLLLSLYFAFRYQKNWNSRFLLGAAFSTGYLIFIHEIYVLVSIPVLVYLLSISRKRRRNLIYILPSFFLPLVLLGIIRFLIFGSPFLSGQSPGIVVEASYMMRQGGILASFMNSPFSGLYGLLFSPSRGIFIYSPILIFAFSGIPSALRRHKSQSLLLLFIFIFYLLILSCYAYWHGGHFFGSRYLIVVLPLLVIFLSFVFDRLSSFKRFFIYLCYLYSLILLSILNFLWLESQVGPHGKTWIISESSKRLGNLFTEILPGFFSGETANIFGEGLFLGSKIILLVLIVIIAYLLIKKLPKMRNIILFTILAFSLVISYDFFFGKRLSPQVARSHLDYEETIRRGRIAMSQERYQEAIETFKEGQKINWELAKKVGKTEALSYKTNFYLADLYSILGRDGLARREYLRGYNNLGILYATYGEYEKAKESWKKALEIDPDDLFARKSLEKLSLVSVK